MSAIAQVQLDSGRVIRIDLNVQGERDVSDRTLLGKFSEAMADVESICKEFEAVLERISPQKAVVKFGLNLGVENSGLFAVVAKATAQANFEVALEWTRTTSS